MPSAKITILHIFVTFLSLKFICSSFWKIIIRARDFDVVFSELCAILKFTWKHLRPHKPFTYPRIYMYWALGELTSSAIRLHWAVFLQHAWIVTTTRRLQVLSKLIALRCYVLRLVSYWKREREGERMLTQIC